MRFRVLSIALAAVVVSFFSTDLRTARDQLVIGITQFPSSFHPNIDSMLAKTYIHSMTARPFTAYDENWQLVCMLCVELP